MCTKNPYLTEDKEYFKTSSVPEGYDSLCLVEKNGDSESNVNTSPNNNSPNSDIST